jgi:patatin-like phospholipase/acyl hydrolase
LVGEREVFVAKLVLSLDGGGIRGAASARFLEKLEMRLGRPLVDVFDLFAGTSTGAIIAVGLGVKRLPAERIAQLYNFENAAKIMDKSVWDRVVGLVQGEPKYTGEGKREVLERYFGTSKLADAVKPTLVVTYDVERRVSAVLKSTKHPEVSAVAAVDASSAAPLYFPTVKVDDSWLIDGGVVANNPTLCAYVEAKKLFGNEEIRVLSVGTGKRTRRIDGEASQGWGFAGWIRHDLLGVVMDESVVHYQANVLLGEEAYLRVNSELTHQSDDLDEVSHGNIRALQLLGDAWFDEFGERALRLLTA